MNRLFTNNKPFAYWFFLLAGIVFMLSILKYLFFDVKADAWFYNFEILAFLLFIIMLIITEKHDNYYRNKIDEQTRTFELERGVLKKENHDLLRKYSAFVKNEDDALNLIIKQEAIVNKLFATNRDSKDNSWFMSAFSEAVISMSAILYTETKPSGDFIVRETYGIPDGFIPSPFSPGEGINGQAVTDGKALVLEDIPDDYFQVSSGLGGAKPKYIYFLPVMKDNNCIALLEIATFKKNDLEKMWYAISSKIIENGIL